MGAGVGNPIQQISGVRSNKAIFAQQFLLNRHAGKVIKENFRLDPQSHGIVDGRKTGWNDET